MLPSAVGGVLSMSGAPDHFHRLELLLKQLAGGLLLEQLRVCHCRWWCAGPWLAGLTAATPQPYL